MIANSKRWQVIMYNKKKEWRLNNCELNNYYGHQSGS